MVDINDNVAKGRLLIFLFKLTLQDSILFYGT